MLLSQHWTIGFSQNFPFEWLRLWVGIVREFWYFFGASKMPLSAHVLLSLAKRYEVAQLFEVDKFQGLYYEQCSPFFESALFLFSRLLKRGGQTLFLRLKAFWCKMWKLLIAVVPILYSIIKNALCRLFPNFNLDAQYFQNLLAMLFYCSARWLRTLGPKLMHPLMHSQIEFSDASTDALKNWIQWCIHWCIQDLKPVAFWSSVFKISSENLTISKV